MPLITPLQKGSRKLCRCGRPNQVRFDLSPMCISCARTFTEGRQTSVDEARDELDRMEAEIKQRSENHAP